MKMIRAVAAMIAVTAAVPAVAQSLSNVLPGDTIVFRRPMLTKPINTPITTTTLEGDTYGWYPYCYQGTPGKSCVAFPDNGSSAYGGDPSQCSTPQDALHTAYLTTQSARYFGDASFLEPAGPNPAPLACSAISGGHGYQCQGGQMVCLSVDNQSYTEGGANPSDCQVPNVGDFTKVLSIYGLRAPGLDVNPATVCNDQSPSFYGRSEICRWTAGSDGNRSISALQKCYQVNSTTLAATEVVDSFCSTDTDTSAADAGLRAQAGLLDPTAPIAVNCGQGDTGTFTSKIVDDNTITQADGKMSRTIDYTFACTAAGKAVSTTQCSGAIAAWAVASGQFATTNGLTLVVSGGNLTRTEVYTEQ